MAQKQKYGETLSVEEVALIRAAIEERTAHISQSARFQVGELVNWMKKIDYQPPTASQLRHLRRAHLLRPQVDDSGDRKIYWYTRADLQDLLVILTLTRSHKIPLTKVSGLLWEEERYRNIGQSRSNQESSVRVPHNHMKRAQFHLRGRLLEIVLTWLFDGHPPYNAIVLLRQKLYPHRTELKVTGKITARDADWSQVDKVLDQRPSDLVVTVSQEGEILHAKDTIEWQQFRYYRWHHIVLSGDLPAADYTLVIGSPPPSALSLSSEVSTPDTARMLTPLLQLCFLPQHWNGSGRADTPLQAMANMIPNIASAWQYCAILVPDRVSGEKLLKVLAHCDHFPGDVNTATATLSPGKLLSGWTYQSGQVCVVQQSIGPDDPRIDRQSEEQAESSIAVPTMVNCSINGVIYVGTRVQAGGGESFPPAQIRVLRLLGSIVGEFIERQVIAQKTRQTGLRILAEKPLQKKSWSELGAYIHQALKEVKKATGWHHHLDNLHIMAVRLDNYRNLQVRSDKVASWVAELVANTAGDFYLNYRSASPTLFIREPFEFVILINNLHLDDDTEQKLRRKLRDHLNTIILPFDQGVRPVRVKCLVWSLSFRYGTLCSKLEERAERELAATLQQEVEDALANLSHIYEAHIYETDGSYQLAHDHYLRAHKRAPHNTYLMRHLAKMRTRLGDYNGAIGWWTRVLHREEHPRFYEHLAEVYAMSQDYPAALQHYRKASELGSGDARSYLGWGQVLLATGDYEDALDKFIKARDLDEANKVLYTLREAEAYAGLKDYRQAMEACERALIWDRDNPAAVKLLLQLLPKYNADLELAEG